MGHPLAGGTFLQEYRTPLDHLVLKFANMDGRIGSFEYDVGPYEDPYMHSDIRISAMEGRSSRSAPRRETRHSSRLNSSQLIASSDRPPRILGASGSTFMENLRDPSPPTLTPTTRRISKAKKGKRVHNCDFIKDGRECGKVFSRAEHLRRHQLNHNTRALFKCEFAHCRQTFQRQDLLKRHVTRHHITNEVGRHHAERHESGSSRGLTSAPRERRHSSIQPTIEEIDQALAVLPASTAALLTSSIPSFSYSLPTPIAPNPADYIPLMDFPPEPDVLNMEPQMDSHQSRTSSVSSGPHSCNASFPASSRLQQLGGEIGQPFDRASSAAPIMQQPWYESLHEPPPGTTKSPSPASSTSSSWVAGAGFADASLMPPITLPGIPETIEKLGSNSPLENSIDPQLLGNDGSKWRGLKMLFTEAGTNDGLEWLEDVLFDGYIEQYWEHFHPYHPILHRPTFVSSHVNPLLAAAMCAIGATFPGSPESEKHAQAMYKACAQHIATSISPPINKQSWLPNIQAVLLLECFAKLRAQRPEIQLSDRFRTLYMSLLEDSPQQRADSMAALKKLSRKPAYDDLYSAWEAWSDVEARRRAMLLAYFLDTQQAIFFEEKAISPFRHLPPNEDISPAFPCPSTLWEAGSIDDWHRLSRGYSDGGIKEARQRAQARERKVSLDCFQSTILSFYLVATAPERSAETVHEELKAISAMVPAKDKQCEKVKHIFYDLVIACNTPVRALLAVSGESWVLGKKLADISEFEEAKSRLRAWVSSDDAKRALWASVHRLRHAFQHDRRGLATPWINYLAALVCWAYGYAANPAAREGPPLRGTAAADDMQRYLNRMDVASWQDLSAVEQPSQTQGLLECVRTQLAGNKGALLNEAHGVLERLVEGRARMCGF